MLIIALLLQTEAHKHQHAYAHMCEQNGIASALSECSSQYCNIETYTRFAYGLLPRGRLTKEKDVLCVCVFPFFFNSRNYLMPCAVCVCLHVGLEYWNLHDSRRLKPRYERFDAQNLYYFLTGQAADGGYTW